MKNQLKFCFIVLLIISGVSAANTGETNDRPSIGSFTAPDGTEYRLVYLLESETSARNGTDDDGQAVGAGLYFYQLRRAEKSIIAKCCC